MEKKQHTYASNKARIVESAETQSLYALILSAGESMVYMQTEISWQIFIMSEKGRFDMYIAFLAWISLSRDGLTQIAVTFLHKFHSGSQVLTCGLKPMYSFGK